MGSNKPVSGRIGAGADTSRADIARRVDYPWQRGV
jgi:hypothetical protein